MKFVLVIYFCSVIAQECKDGITYPTEFNTFKDCLYKGYEQSQILLDEYPPKIINEFKVLAKFVCIEQKGKEV